MSSDGKKKIKRLEIVTEEEYVNAQNHVLGSMARDLKNASNACCDIREVVELISGLGGTVAFYKKESDYEIVYDYAISMPLGYDYRDFFGEDE